MSVHCSFYISLPHPPVSLQCFFFFFFGLVHLFYIFGPICGSFANRTVAPNLTEGTNTGKIDTIVFLNGNVCHGFTKTALNFLFLFLLVSLVVLVLPFILE